MFLAPATRLGLACASLVLSAPLALGQTVVHDEGTDGDLSGTPGAPTAVVFGAGSNIVRGSMGGGDTRDFFTFTIPAGGTLEALLLNQFEDIPSGEDGDIGYNAIIGGTTGLTPNMTTANDFLGGSHMSFIVAGADILPNLAQPVSNGSGFSVPLGPGDYTYVIQETGTEQTAYEIEFVVGDSWEDLGCALAGATGDPLLVGEGFLSAGSLNVVTLTNAAGNATAGLFLGFASTPVAFKGGTLKPFPFFGPFIIPTDPLGSVALPLIPPPAPSGTELFVQWAIQDPGAIFNVSLSNAIKGTVP